ncbi:hypothetical protein V8C86DRAFT_1207868 [Haematococcus lacustris]
MGLSKHAFASNNSGLFMHALGIWPIIWLLMTCGAVELCRLLFSVHACKRQVHKCEWTYSMLLVPNRYLPFVSRMFLYLRNSTSSSSRMISCLRNCSSSTVTSAGRTPAG